MIKIDSEAGMSTIDSEAGMTKIDGEAGMKVDSEAGFM
jgi:hypothetical protein